MENPPQLIPPKKCIESDLVLMNTFNSFIPYYWCLSADVPDKIKLTCLINQWMNVPMALMDMSKQFANTKLQRQAGKILITIQSRL
jgi:hypothetical protein